MTFKKIIGRNMRLSLPFLFISISICLIRIITLHSYYLMWLTESNELEVNF